MSNGAKKLGKEFQGPPKFPKVAASFDGKQVNVEIWNTDWTTAVNLLIDGLKIARAQEMTTKEKTEPSRIIIPQLAGIPPLKES